MPVWCGGWTNPTANPPSGGGVLYYNNGNVGIGTTGPQTKLDISLAGNATEATLRTTVANNAINLVGPYVNNNFYPGIVWSTSDNSPTLTKAGIWAKHTNSGSYLNFGTSNAYGTGINNTAMVIDYNGNVGIGTTGPANILTIVQTSATDPIADAWTVYSSKRWKENIAPLNNSLDKIMQLQGVSFNWKADGKYDIGLIAEDAGKIVPEAVEYEENGIDAKSVDYNKIVPLLIESAKEQQKQIKELENKVNSCLQK